MTAKKKPVAYSAGLHSKPIIVHKPGTAHAGVPSTFGATINPNAKPGEWRGKYEPIPPKRKK